MRKRLGLLAMATAFVLVVPVAASAADEADDAPPEPRPIDLEDRFDTFDEAAAAVAERMTRALDRMTDRYDRVQDRDDVPEGLLEHLSTAIDQISEHLAAVDEAESFAELNSTLEEARNQRRELREERPHRPHRCRPAPGFGAGADQTT